ncbi:MAG TPA: acyl-CoA dehydrogenase family protein [Fimbriimonas sp.]|nr:acyl-CoA dehydrogenase family protein [Fimbriimonas sp.]
MSKDREVLEKAEEFLKRDVAPNAEKMDWDYETLKSAVDGLCELDLMALKRPEAYGGPEISDTAVRHFQELIARYSGALAFLQTQHQGVVGMIASGPNQVLKDEYLPGMGDGRKLIGVGFSQLRRPGPPIMRAEPVDGGYRLNGNVPWVTGWMFYPEFMIGASLPDGRALFAPVPLSTQEGVRISEPMALAAMASANTVSVEIEDFFVPEERVALIRDAGWIQNNDQINIAQQGSFALGCAQAGLDVLQRNADRRKLAFAQEAYERLSAELEDLRQATEEARSNIREETTQERLELRAWQIELAVRCAHAGVASSSGAANSMSHPAQRIYREALVYTVSAQTGPIMEATLDRISRKA